MKTYFTSDLHLQSSQSPGIIDWAHRPFKSVEKHDAALIRGINERVKPDDILIHVGDFLNYGKNRGIETGRNKPDFYVSQIHAPIIFLEGNHDANNHVRVIGRTLTRKVGRYIVSVGHFPSYDSRWEQVETPTYTDGHLYFHIHLCGHVHDTWKFTFTPHVLNINVGTDVWNYRPVSEAELDAFITKTLMGKIERK